MAGKVRVVLAVCAAALVLPSIAADNSPAQTDPKIRAWHAQWKDTDKAYFTGKLLASYNKLADANVPKAQRPVTFAALNRLAINPKEFGSRADMDEALDNIQRVLTDMSAGFNAQTAAYGSLEKMGTNWDGLKRELSDNAKELAKVLLRVKDSWQAGRVQGATYAAAFEQMTMKGLDARQQYETERWHAYLDGVGSYVTGLFPEKREQLDKVLHALRTIRTDIDMWQANRYETLREQTRQIRKNVEALRGQDTPEKIVSAVIASMSDQVRAWDGVCKARAAGQPVTMAVIDKFAPKYFSTPVHYDPLPSDLASLLPTPQVDEAPVVAQKEVKALRLNEKGSNKIAHERLKWTERERIDFINELLAFKADLDAGKIPLQFEPITYADLYEMERYEGKSLGYYTPKVMMSKVKTALVANAAGFDKETARVGLLDEDGQIKHQQRLNAAAKAMTAEILDAKERKTPYKQWGKGALDRDRARIINQPEFYFDNITLYLSTLAQNASNEKKENEFWDISDILNRIHGETISYYVLSNEMRREIADEIGDAVGSKKLFWRSARPEDQTDVMTILAVSTKPILPEPVETPPSAADPVQFVGNDAGAPAEWLARQQPVQEPETNIVRRVYMLPKKQTTHTDP